jgi:hypothetical protein
MSRTPGRKIDSYHYTSKDGVHVEVELRLFGDVLIARCPGRELEVRDKNIADLKRKVAAELERILSIVWEPKLLVEMTDEGNHHFQGDTHSAGFSLKYSFWEVATTAGKPISRQVSESNCGKHYVQDGWPGDDGGAWATSGVLIDDTPAHRAQLEAINTAIVTLRQQLNKLLSADKILTTLQNVKVLGLPAPKGT